MESTSSPIASDRAPKRIWTLILVLGAAGTLAAWVLYGPRAGGGFALGTVISALNYRWLKRTVDLLGEADRPKRSSAGVLSLRYLILGTAAYATLAFFELDVVAALFGLLVTVAAVILEILFELTYGT